MADFLGRYIVLPRRALLVVAAWVIATHLMDVWDRFPHLAIASPEKRCGKTRLLQLLTLIVHEALHTTNISPAALYRLIAIKKPTLLLDEAQSLVRRQSESAEVIRELLNAGIDRDAKVYRCGGENNDVQEFPVYSAKALAQIGTLDSVLLDRCLSIDLRRKTDTDSVESYRSRIVEPIGHALRERIMLWAEQQADEVAKVYDHLEPFPIQNDRMAELLLPVQAVIGVSTPRLLSELLEYAKEIDDRDEESESPSIRLLSACRSIFKTVKDSPKDGKFLATQTLITRLVNRTEEPWGTHTRGKSISPEALATLLRQFDIRSGRNAKQTSRGYFAHHFEDAWARYLPPPPSKKAANPSKAVGSK